MLKKIVIISSMIISSTLLLNSAAIAGEKKNTQRMVLNFKGTGSAVPRSVPDNTGLNFSTNGMLAANCFEADVFDLETGHKLGTAEDCLSEIAVGDGTSSGSGVQVVGTTIFRLKKGRLVIQGLTSVQPINWPTSNSDGLQFTHITGANSPHNAVLNGTGDLSNTGRFRNMDAVVRLSGQVNLEKAGDGEITFDCIFVVDLTRRRK